MLAGYVVHISTSFATINGSYFYLLAAIIFHIFTSLLRLTIHLSTILLRKMVHISTNIVVIYSLYFLLYHTF